jgi:hypothetical protein
MWKDRVFAIWAKAHWLERQRRQFMCKHKLMMTSLSLPLYLSIYLSLSLYLYLSISIYLSVYFSLFISLYISICLFLSFYLSLYIYLFISLFLSLSISVSSKLVLKVKHQDDASCSMVFCQKNFLEERFHGDYLRGCLLTHGVSQIL